MKIAVDAMGGDFAPGVVIEGLADAISDHPDCTSTTSTVRSKMYR